MPKYRVKAGPSPFAGNKPGTVIELTEEEAAGFLDKLDLIDKPAAARGISASLKNELNVKIEPSMKFISDEAQSSEFEVEEEEEKPAKTKRTRKAK